MTLFQINNHHHACIKKNSRRASKQSEFLTKRGFFFEISDTEICDNQKKLFDHLQFLFDSHVENYRPQRVDKKNQSNDNILNFIIIIKYFYTKKLNFLLLKNSNMMFKL